MARTTLRERYREAPALTAFSVGGALAVYAAVGVVRPRWLTAYARHPVRNALLSTVWGGAGPERRRAHPALGGAQPARA